MVHTLRLVRRTWWPMYVCRYFTPQNRSLISSADAVRHLHQIFFYSSNGFLLGSNKSILSSLFWTSSYLKRYNLLIIVDDDITYGGYQKCSALLSPTMLCVGMIVDLSVGRHVFKCNRCWPCLNFHLMSAIKLLKEVDSFNVVHVISCSRNVAST